MTGTTPRPADLQDTTAETARALGVGPRELIVLLSSVMALMAMGLDLILPGFDDIRETFDLADDASETGRVIVFYFFGLAGAQFVWGPLADRFGRKPILYAGITIYMLGSAASAVAPTFGFLLGARVLWGVGAAAARVVATAIIRDCFVGERMAKAMSLIMAVFVLVPVVAPLLGSVIIDLFSWRAAFWFCLLWAAAIGIWSLRLKESLDPAHVRGLQPLEVARSYAEVVRHKVTVGYTVATTFLQVGFTLYLAASEFIIGEIYHRPDQFPLVFGAIAVVFGLSAILNSRIVERLGIDGVVRLASMAGIVFAALLVIATATADGRPNFVLFIALTGLTLGSFMLLMPNMNTAGMTPIGHVAGSGSALMSAFRIGVGSAIANQLTGLVDESVTPFAVVLLIVVALTAATAALVRQLA